MRSPRSTLRNGLFGLVALTLVLAQLTGCGDRPSDYVNSGDDTSSGGGDTGGDPGDGSSGPGPTPPGGGSGSSGPFLQITDAPGSQVSAVVAHNRTDGEYLVAWTDSSDVFYAIVRTSGGNVELVVDVVNATEDDSGAQTLPTVSWGDSRNEFMLAYQSTQTGNVDIYTRRITAGGVTDADGTNITEPSLMTENTPHIAYDEDDNNYLVVYNQLSGAGAVDVIGVQVDEATGGRSAGPIAIAADSTFSELNPRVAYNAMDDEWLVVWQDSRSGSTAIESIWGRRINAITLGFIGAGFSISTGFGTVTNTFPDLAWNSVDNEFLVVWEEGTGATRNIHGQRVQGRSTLLTGQSFDIAAVSGISEELEKIAYSTSGNQFLVTYVEASASRDVLGVDVLGASSTVGASFEIAAGMGSQTRPDVVVTGTTYVVAYDDDEGGSPDIYVTTGSF